TDACNDGVCDEDAKACEAQPAREGGACDDGLICTLSDACAEGKCVGAPRDCSHLDTTCTVGQCGEDGECVAVPRNEGGACDDGLIWTLSDACAEGKCVGAPRHCSQLDTACTVGQCGEDGECVAVPRNEGGACDDGLFCTVNDACAEGECVGTARDCSGVA